MQNPFCICQECFRASIHFLFNILQDKIEKKKHDKLELCTLEKHKSLNVHLLKRANIHGMKNVLRIVWMLLKRDGFLEGFSLDDKDNRK